MVMDGFWRAGALALGMMCAAGPARAQMGEAPSPPPIATPEAAAPIAFGRPIERAGDALILREASFAFGPITLRAPRIEIFGATLSASEIAALLSSGDDPAARVARFTATSVALPRVEFIVEAGGVTQTTIYSGTRLESISNGRIGRMTVASAEMEGTDETGAPTSVVIAGISSEGVDVAAGLRMFFGPPTTGGERLADRFAVETYAITMKDAAVKMRNMTAADYRAGAMKRPLKDILGELSSLSKDANGGQIGAGMDLAREILPTVELESARIEGVEIAATGQQSVARLTGAWLRDVKAGRASFGVDSIRFDGKDAVAMAAGFEVLDYDPSDVFRTFAQAVRDSAKLNDVNPVTLIPTFRRIALAKVLACKPAPQGCPDDEADFWMEDASLERAVVADGLDWRFAIKGFRTRAKGETPAGAGTASSVIEWRPDARALSLREARLTHDGYGEASVALDLQNVLPQIFTEGRSGALFALAPIALNRAALRLVDAGGVDKFAAEEAKVARIADRPKAKPGKGKPADRRSPRDILAARVARDISAMGAAPAVAALKDALVGFVRDSRQPLALTLTAKPAIGGVDFLGLKDAKALWNRVNVTSERR